MATIKKDTNEDTLYEYLKTYEETHRSEPVSKESFDTSFNSTSDIIPTKIRRVSRVSLKNEPYDPFDDSFDIHLAEISETPKKFTTETLDSLPEASTSNVSSNDKIAPLKSISTPKVKKKPKVSKPRFSPTNTKQKSVLSYFEVKKDKNESFPIFKTEVEDKKEGEKKLGSLPCETGKDKESDIIVISSDEDSQFSDKKRKIDLEKGPDLKKCKFSFSTKSSEANKAHSQKILEIPTPASEQVSRISYSPSKEYNNSSSSSSSKPHISSKSHDISSPKLGTVYKSSSKSHKSSSSSVFNSSKSSSSSNSPERISRSKMASIVVKYLMCFYNKHEKLMSKENFQKVARELSHEAIEKGIRDDSAIKKLIDSRFRKSSS